MSRQTCHVYSDRLHSTSFKVRILSHKRTRQSGISLYTMLAAVVVLGVLAATVVVRFNASDSRATALYALAQNVGQSAKQFHLDSACYPASIQIMSAYSQGSDMVSCDSGIRQNRWNGPYLKNFAIDQDGAAVLPDYGPAARLWVRMKQDTPVIRIEGITQSIGDGFALACADGTCDVNEDRIVYSYTGDALPLVSSARRTAQEIIDFAFTDFANASLDQINDPANRTNQEVLAALNDEYRGRGYSTFVTDEMIKVNLNNDDSARIRFYDGFATISAFSWQDDVRNEYAEIVDKGVSREEFSAIRNNGDYVTGYLYNQ